MGISIAAVPNWEWMGNHLEWLRAADLLICPTKHTYRYVCDWRLRHGYGWDVAHLPWPIDADRFPFQERTRCDRFVFINGLGGHTATRLDGSVTLQKRKGLEIMVDAMTASPRLNFVLYSLDPKVPKLPPNVEHRPAPADNRELYQARRRVRAAQPSGGPRPPVAGMPGRRHAAGHHRCPAHERAQPVGGDSRRPGRNRDFRRRTTRSLAAYRPAAARGAFSRNAPAPTSPARAARPASSSSASTTGQAPRGAARAARRSLSPARSSHAFASRKGITMPRIARPVEECPHRLPKGGESSDARCRLIEQMIGAGERIVFQVGRDACNACCKSFTPTPAELEPGDRLTALRDFE